MLDEKVIKSLSLIREIVPPQTVEEMFNEKDYPQESNIAPGL